MIGFATVHEMFSRLVTYLVVLCALVALPAPNAIENIAVRILDDIINAVCAISLRIKVQIIQFGVERKIFKSITKQRLRIRRHMQIILYKRMVWIRSLAY